MLSRLLLCALCCCPIALQATHEQQRLAEKTLLLHSSLWLVSEIAREAAMETVDEMLRQTRGDYTLDPETEKFIRETLTQDIVQLSGQSSLRVQTSFVSKMLLGGKKGRTAWQQQLREKFADPIRYACEYAVREQLRAALRPVEGWFFAASAITQEATEQMAKTLQTALSTSGAQLVRRQQGTTEAKAQIKKSISREILSDFDIKPYQETRRAALQKAEDFLWEVEWEKIAQVAVATAWEELFLQHEKLLEWVSVTVAELAQQHKQRDLLRNEDLQPLVLADEDPLWSELLSITQIYYTCSLKELLQLADDRALQTQFQKFAEKHATGSAIALHSPHSQEELLSYIKEVNVHTRELRKNQKKAARERLEARLHRRSAPNSAGEQHEEEKAVAAAKDQPVPAAAELATDLELPTLPARDGAAEDKKRVQPPRVPLPVAAIADPQENCCTVQ